MHCGHCTHAIAGAREDFDERRVGDLAALEIEQAGDDLEIVFHPVVDLVEQHFFLAERSLHRLLSFEPRGHIHGGPAHPDRLGGAHERE